MLITLITIAIASLAATPLVAPAVRRLASRNPSTNTKNDHSNNSYEKDDVAGAQLNDHLMSIDESPLPTLAALPKVVVPAVPQFSLELVKPVSSLNSPNKQTTTTPLVEVVWKTGTNQKTKVNSQKQKDNVENIRETPSAERLFTDSQDAKFYESANKEDPPRLITPKPIGGKPKAARQITPIKLEETTHDSAIEPSSSPYTQNEQQGSVKRYQVGAEKFKMNPVASQASATKSKPTAIPMFISTTPNLTSSDQHFEVIKPQKADKKKSFTLFDQPEQIASGERSWLGVQPLYIDFSPFFSLDSLMEISPQTRNSRRRFPKEALNSTSSSRGSEHRSTQDMAFDSTIGGFQSINLLRDLNSEMDHFLHSEQEDVDYEDEEYEWSEQQETELEDFEEVPEWQSLLGLSNHFLFDMKLNQKRMAQHEELTDQKLEDAIVFKITSGVSGPEVQHNSHEKE